MGRTNPSTESCATSILTLQWFRNRVEAKVGIEEWRRHYNEVRPHSSLGYLTPGEFKAAGAALTAIVNYPMTVNRLPVGQQFPIAVQVPLVFKANIRGGSAPLEYRFYL